MLIKQSIRLIRKTLVSLLMATPLTAMAQEAINIPYMDDAKIFAEFSDELPAIVNYYTLHSEQEIITFYQSEFGEANHTQVKRGRLTLVFEYDNKQLRVIISSQSNRRQVDAILR